MTIPTDDHFKPYRWITVECPQCGALPREHCREPFIGFVHLARHDAAATRDT